MRIVPILLVGCGWFDKTGNDEPLCLQQATVVAMDEVTPAGFSPADLVSSVTGERTATLTWSGDDTTGLVLATAWDGGEARFVEVSPNPDWPGVGPGDTGELACRDRVEVDVAWTFRTDDGAFDEAATVALSATSVEQADFDARIDQADLGGTYRIPEIDPTEYEEVYVAWHGAVLAADTEGWIGGTASGKDEGGGVASGVGLEIGSWSSADADQRTTRRRAVRSTRR